MAGGVQQAGAFGTGLVISQIYGGGGNTGATYANDFVELYNPSTSDVPLAGLSVQYTSASGTALFGADSGQLTELTGTIPGHGYFLVQEGSGGGPGAALPLPDQIDGTPINLAAASGKVALVTGTTPLGCNGGSTPCDDAAKARIVDLVGYGFADFFEGSGPAPGASATTSAQRKLGGCQDTNNNAADFAATVPAPRNSSSPANLCTAGSPPTAEAGGPYSVDEGAGIQLFASGSDPDGGPLTYAWDLDGNGSFETSGQNVTFSAIALDGPSTHTVTVRVTDAAGLTATDASTVNVANVAPTATFAAPGSTFTGSPFTLSLTGPLDPSAADTSAGFTYAFDCGSGYDAFGTSSTASCLAADTGSLSVGGKIRDKDGGLTEYRATVNAAVTFSGLCDLVEAYTTDEQTISMLCRRLEQAAKAPNATTKGAHLASFRDHVDKSGVFSPAQAETLKRLSLLL
jgi:hypothetical protein